MKRAGGTAHHFQAIQVPFSLAKLEALFDAHHRVGSAMLPALAAARACGLATLASAALNRMQLPLATLQQLAGRGPALSHPAQVALHFARSVPGIDCALFGTADPAHVKQALEVLALAAMQWNDGWEGIQSDPFSRRVAGSPGRQGGR